MIFGMINILTPTVPCGFLLDTHPPSSFLTSFFPLSGLGLWCFAKGTVSYLAWNFCPTLCALRISTDPTGVFFPFLPSSPFSPPFLPGHCSFLTLAYLVLPHCFFVRKDERCYSAKAFFCLLVLRTIALACIRASEEIPFFCMCVFPLLFLVEVPCT